MLNLEILYNGPGFIIPRAPGTKEELSDDELISDDFLSNSKNDFMDTFIVDNSLSLKTSLDSKDKKSISIFTKIENEIEKEKKITEAEFSIEDSYLDKTIDDDIGSAEEEDCSQSINCKKKNLSIDLINSESLINEKVFKFYLLL